MQKSLCYLPWGREYGKEAVLNGAKSFIVKPFKKEHLIKTLKNLII